MHVVDCNIMGRLVPNTRAEVLDKAPDGCQALFVHIPDHEDHYKAWIQAEDGQWYECDSIYCTANTTGIRLLTDEDWWAFAGTIFCLVKLDGYEHNSTLIKYSRGPPLGPAADALWLDGTTLMVHTSVMRTAPRPTTGGNITQIEKSTTQINQKTHPSNAVPPEPKTDEAMPAATQTLPTQKTQIAQPPPLQQRPSVYWCNPLAHPEALEISSDEEIEVLEELDDTMQMVEETPHDENEIWVAPASVGLYCELQEDLQCLCHAWHALLGRRMAPGYFWHRLETSNAPKQELDKFGPRGPYHIGAANLYAVEHSLNDTHVTLKEFADSLTRRQTKAQILAKAPANCRGIIAHFKLPSNEYHFTAWRQADDGHWYNCDSLPYVGPTMWGFCCSWTQGWLSSCA
jgi:hypothetical protein